MITKKYLLLSFVVVSAIVTGCKPTTPPPAAPVDTTHPANMIGKWKAEFTLKVPRTIKRPTEEIINLTQQDIVNATLGMNLQADASANFEADQDSKMLETIAGSWKQIDDYLVIQQANGGFVGFRVSSQSTNQMTVFSRTGETIQFNRIP